MIYDFYGKALAAESSGGGIFDATQVKTSQQLYFQTGNVGIGGQVIACKAGETFYWNGKFTGVAAYAKAFMLSSLPDGITDDTVIMGEGLEANADGGYTATADGALFFPNIAYDTLDRFETFIEGGRYTNYLIQNFPFSRVDSYYGLHCDENHVFHASPSVLTLSGILRNYIPLIGAKVAVLGDSLSEQSAGYAPGKDAYGYYQGTYDHDGWFSRIARKYNMDYRVHGVGMQRWYNTASLPSGAVKAVKSLLESGYEPDYIVLEYGTNDIWSGYTQFGTAEDAASDTEEKTIPALRWCIETLQTQLPKAKLIVVMPCIRLAGGAIQQDNYYDLIGGILDEYGVRRVDMKNESGIVASMMAPDGVHLAEYINGSGYNNTTEAVARFSCCLEAEMLNL